MKTPESLTDAIRAGKAVPVVGAGVSASVTGLPSWRGLIESGLEFAGESGGCDPSALAEGRALLAADKLVPAAQAMKTLLGAPGGQYAAWLENVFERAGDANAATATIDSISDLLCPIVATTNYDDLLEKFMVGRRREVTWQEPAAMLKALSGKDAVFHLHGIYTKPRSVVLGADNYEALVAEEAYRSVLRTLWIDRTLLFIGCSFSGLEDPDFGRMLEWFATTFPDTSHRHFALMKEESYTVEEQRKWLHDLRIQAIPYGPNYSDLAPAIRALNPHWEKAYAGRILLSKRLLEQGRSQDVEEFVTVLEGAGAKGAHAELHKAATVLFKATKDDRAALRENLTAMQLLSRSMVSHDAMRKEIKGWRRGITRYRGSFRTTVQQAAAALFLYPESLLNALKQRGVHVHQNFLSGYCRSVFEMMEKFGNDVPDVASEYWIENLNRILTSLDAVLKADPEEIFPDLQEGSATVESWTGSLLVARQSHLELRRRSALGDILATLPLDIDLREAEFARIGGREAVIFATRGALAVWDPTLSAPFKEHRVNHAYGISSVSHRQVEGTVESLVAVFDGQVQLLRDLDLVDSWFPLRGDDFFQQIVLLSDGQAFGIPTGDFSLREFGSDGSKEVLSAAGLAKQLSALPGLAKHWRSRISQYGKIFGRQLVEGEVLPKRGMFQHPDLKKVEIGGKPHLLMHVQLSLGSTDTLILVLSVEERPLRVVSHFLLKNKLIGDHVAREGPGGQLRVACALLSDFKLGYDLAVWARGARTAKGIIFAEEKSSIRTRDDLVRIALGDSEEAVAADDSGGLFRFSLKDGEWEEISRDPERRIRALCYHEARAK